MIFFIIWAVGFVPALIGYHAYQKIFSWDRDEYCEAFYGLAFAVSWPFSLPFFVLYLISKCIGRLLW